MKEVKVKIVNSIGLHARPAAMFVKEATSFACDIKLLLGTKEVNGKSIMGVMGLAAKQGDEITIRAEGPDEEKCVEKLAELVKSGFGEE